MAALVDCTPEVMQFTPDTYEHFIQMLFVARSWRAPLKLVGEQPAEGQALTADALVGDYDAVGSQDCLAVAQCHAEAMMQWDCVLDQLGHLEETLKVGVTHPE